MNDAEKAAICYTESLKRKDCESTTNADTAEAVIYLAKYYKVKGNLDEAVKYARRLHDFNGAEREEANSLIREMEAIRDRKY